jgi:ribonuclease T2
MATTKARATYLLVLWALVAADLFGTGLARASLAAVGKEQREFDYFALALQWPGTICASTHKCCAINGCCRSVPATAAVLSTPARSR